jgi:general secretion pathway protein G
MPKLFLASVIQKRRISILSYQFGFTLLEMMTTVALIGVIAMVTTSSYMRYAEYSENQIAIRDLKVLALQIEAYAGSNNGVYPSDLNVLGLDTYEDPWGNPYQYLNIAEVKGNGKVRKDRNLVPINSDYDLYSMGPDGRSVSPLTAKHSRDDIVRANNGRFFGIAEDY